MAAVLRFVRISGALQFRLVAHLRDRTLNYHVETIEVVAPGRQDAIRIRFEAMMDSFLIQFPKMARQRCARDSKELRGLPLVT